MFPALSVLYKVHLHFMFTIYSKELLAGKSFWLDNMSLTSQEITLTARTWKFITMFTEARHFFCFQSDQASPVTLITFSFTTTLTSNLHLCLGLTNDRLPSGFPAKTPYVFSFPSYVLQAPLIQFSSIVQPKNFKSRSFQHHHSLEQPTFSP